MSDEKPSSIHELIINQLDRFSKKIEDVDDKIDRVSSNLEFLKGINAERMVDIKEIKDTLKQNSREHQDFSNQLIQQSEKIKNLEETDKEKKRKKEFNLGIYVGVGLGVLGFIGTLISYIF